MKHFPSVAIQEPNLLLPNKQIDLCKWAVVACDQYTSQPSYWEKVEALVGEDPSTYKLILPEAFLGTEKEEKHAHQVFPNMESYLAQGLFDHYDGFLLIERTFDDSQRLGLIAALDLDQYDFTENSQSLIRATEGTIVDRLPPRIAIREKAKVEIPHILVLIDDPQKTVIEPLLDNSRTEPVYDFDLMLDGGHIRAYPVAENAKQKLATALEDLKSPATQNRKYDLKPGTPPMLYAMGDGNHSLATAKAIWEKNKVSLPEDHPSRFALVEIVNVHDSGIEFEAIHRLLSGVHIDLLSSCKDFFEGAVSYQDVDDYAILREWIDGAGNGEIRFGLFNQNRFRLLSITNPIHTLAVGNAQAWIDHLVNSQLIGNVDYIHGADTILALGTKPGCAGVYLPAMPKDALFKSVIKDGPLPRKTFSMGEAHQKRYYLECRIIK